MSHLRIAPIGRNEGDRRGCCLTSVIGLALSVDYFQSSWADGNVERARGTAGRFRVC